MSLRCTPASLFTPLRISSSLLIHNHESCYPPPCHLCCLCLRGYLVRLRYVMTSREERRGGGREDQRRGERRRGGERKGKRDVNVYFTGTSSDHLKITSVTVTPDPPVAGQNLTVSAAGVLGTPPLPLLLSSSPPLPPLLSPLSTSPCSSVVV